MTGFLGVATAFPTALLSFGLVVVVGYWVLVLVGGVGHAGHAGHGGHAGHAGHGGRVVHGGHHLGHAGSPANASHSGPPGHGTAGESTGHGGPPGGVRGGVRSLLGLGGVPITVAVSLVVVFAWFAALTGQVLLDGRHGGVLLLVALACGWLGARVLVRPLRRLVPEPAPPPSRLDFVGSGCVIRTGRVGPDFGQAEVRAEDGSAALVQVRQSLDDAAGPGNALTKGASALIYDYDAEGEFFRVMPDLSASS